MTGGLLLLLLAVVRAQFRGKKMWERWGVIGHAAAKRAAAPRLPPSMGAPDRVSMFTRTQVGSTAMHYKKALEQALLKGQSARNRAAATSKIKEKYKR